MFPLCRILICVSILIDGHVTIGDDLSNSTSGGLVKSRLSPEEVEVNLNTWSQDFLRLLGVELSVGGDSWEKQLEPVMVFVKDLQEDPNFVDWIKYLVRSVITATGMSPDSLARSASKTPMNLLTALILYLVADDNIVHTLDFLKNNDESKLVQLTPVVQAYLPKDFRKEKNLGRFFKRLYNAKRKHFRPKNTGMQSAELSQDLNKTPIVNILNKNQNFPKVLESVTDIQALKTFLVDIIKTLHIEPHTVVVPFSSTAQQTFETAATTTLLTTDTTTTAPSTTETVTTSTSTTTETSTTSMSIEDRVAAMFPNQPAKFNPPANDNKFSWLDSKPNFGKFNPKQKFGTKKVKALTSTTPRTTTAYQKYPVKPTSIMVPDDSDLTTIKPVIPSSIKLQKSNIWAESDVTSCHVGKTCIFRCRIFVSGFEAVLSQQWLEVQKKLTKTLKPVLRQIVIDSYLGSIGDYINIKNVAPTSVSTAEIIFDLKIVDSAIAVQSADVALLFNGVDGRIYAPYELDRALTEVHLIRPDNRAQESSIVPAAFVSGSNTPISNYISTTALISIMATVLIAGPLLAWASHLLCRRIKTKNVKRKMMDESPLIYSELEAAISSLKTNNLYSSAGKKHSVSKSSIFDVEREKEIKFIEEKKAESFKRDEELYAAKKAADRPLPPVPDVFLINSPTPSLPSSLKKTKKTSRFMSSWFVTKKAVRFSDFNDQDFVEEDEDDDELLTGIAPGISSPRFKRRHSSFRRFASSLRMRRSHVIKQSSIKRQTVEGFFNVAFIPDCNQLPQHQPLRVPARNDYGICDQEIYGIHKVEEQHDYETIGHHLTQKHNQPQSKVAIVEHHHDNDSEFPAVFNSTSYISESDHSSQIYDEMVGQDITPEKLNPGQNDFVEILVVNGSAISGHSKDSCCTTSDYSASSLTVDANKFHQDKEMILVGEDLVSYQVYGTI